MYFFIFFSQIQVLDMFLVLVLVIPRGTDEVGGMLHPQD